MLDEFVENEVKEANPSVLVVDDETDGLRELVEAVGRLGFHYHVATSAHDALSKLRFMPDVGVIVTDISMPGMDGLEMIDCVRNKLDLLAPEAIVVTGHASFDHAVSALRLSAVDFLRKPLSAGDLSEALANASTRWKHRRSAIRSVPQGPAQRPRTHREGGSEDARPREGHVQSGTASGRAILTYEEQLRQLIKLRRVRGRILDYELFADPAWDFLVELAIAEFEDRDFTISGLCACSNVSYATAYRQIQDLVQRGLLRRENDTEDRRRVFVTLSPEARAKIFEILDQVKHG